MSKVFYFFILTSVSNGNIDSTNPICSFTQEFITSESLKQFPKECETVFGNIQIDENCDVSEKQLTSAFKNMKVLYGNLNVYRTNFTSGKFLEGLEEIECDKDGFFSWERNEYMIEIGMKNLTRCCCQFNVNENKKLISMNLPNLKNFSSMDASQMKQIEMLVYDNSPEGCIDIEELSHFIANDNLFMSVLPANFCAHTTDAINGEKTCVFESFNITNMEPDCVRIVGQVRIDSGDEEHVHKLNLLKFIYGTLNIENTNLTTVDFLNELEYIVTLESVVVSITVRNNLQLSNFSLPKLKGVRSSDTLQQGYVQRWISFYDNHESLKKWLVNNSICNPYMDILNETVLYRAEIDKKSCDKTRDIIVNEEVHLEKNVEEWSGKFAILTFLTIPFLFKI